MAVVSEEKYNGSALTGAAYTVPVDKECKLQSQSRSTESHLWLFGQPLSVQYNFLKFGIN